MVNQLVITVVIKLIGQYRNGPGRIVATPDLTLFHPWRVARSADDGSGVGNL